MDMKRILQAMDGVSTKPVEGANDMKKFLQVITEGANPHKVSLPVQMAMQHYQQQSEVTVETKSPIRTSVNKYFREVEQEFNEQQNQKRQLINQYAQTIAERVLMKESVLSEKSTTEKQARTMAAAAHNPEFAKKVGIKQSVAKEFNQKDKGTALLSNAMKGKKKKVKENEIPGHSMGFTGGVGPGMQDYVVDEAPIAMDPSEPNNPLIHGHQGGNPATLKDRISRARAQLIELAERAQSNDLLVWESICRDAKGGMFMGLEQNLEQIRHGIAELAAKRRKGGTASRGIDKHIGEAVMPKIKAATPKPIKPKVKTSTCRTGQVQTGMQTKDGKLVPKCSVK
jgi:hypothetical protein